MRKRIYEIINISKDNDKISAVYDYLMLFFIIISIIPLCFKTTNKLFICTISAAKFSQASLINLLCDFYSSRNFPERNLGNCN